MITRVCEREKLTIDNLSSRIHVSVVVGLFIFHHNSVKIDTIIQQKISLCKAKVGRQHSLQEST